MDNSDRIACLLFPPSKFSLATDKGAGPAFQTQRFQAVDEFHSAILPLMRRLPPLKALRAFEAAARHLSFKAAADELGLTPTAVSHQIRLLETVVGGALFRRRPRPLTLTTAGEVLFPVVRSGFDQMADAFAAAHSGFVSRRQEVGAMAAIPLVPNDIRSPEQLASTVEQPIASPPRLSIVVLPFANIAGDSEQEYFADGITESLTTDLSRISGAFVIARSTAFAYKTKRIDLRQVGRDLNVRYALEGSVQRSGNRLRVSVQLSDCSTDTHLWAERFDQELANLFEVQDEIVAALRSTGSTAD
jgi:TolB-like protein